MKYWIPIACIVCTLLSACGGGSRGIGSESSSETTGAAEKQSKHSSSANVALQKQASVNTIYVIKNDSLTPLPQFPSPSKPDTFKPWPLKPHITRFLPFKDTLYMGINGKGIAVLSKNDKHQAQNSILLSKLHSAFTDRTLGGLYYYNEGILAHVYTNNIFNGLPQSRKAGISFFQIQPAASEEKQHTVKPINVEEAVKTEEWEAVGFEKREKTWYIAWKFWNGDGAEYQYTAFNPESENGLSITEKEFLKASHPAPLTSAPLLKRIFEYLPDIDISSNKSSTNREPVYLIYYTCPEKKDTSQYVYGSFKSLKSEENHLKELYLYENSSGYYILIPPHTIYYKSKKDTSSSLKGYTDISPSGIPPHITFTGIAEQNGKLYISWEEKKFPGIGAAGLSVLYYKE